MYLHCHLFYILTVMLAAMGLQMYCTGHHRHVLRKMTENFFQSACVTFHVFFVQNAHCFHIIIELENTACRHFIQIYFPIENIFFITTGNSQNIIKKTPFMTNEHYKHLISIDKDISVLYILRYISF